MARLILKSPYIKSTGGASGYLRYIATRERVELIPDDRPPTRKQEQLIAKLVKDFPDSKTLYEYEDYLTKPTKEGIRQIKSKLTNDIFRNEMLHLYEQKSESRDELVRQARRAMLELVQTMRDGVCNHPDAEQLMLELAAQLETVKGKKRYAERRG